MNNCPILPATGAPFTWVVIGAAAAAVVGAIALAAGRRRAVGGVAVVILAIAGVALTVDRPAAAVTDCPPSPTQPPATTPPPSTTTPATTTPATTTPGTTTTTLPTSTSTTTPTTTSTTTTSTTTSTTTTSTTTSTTPATTTSPLPPNAVDDSIFLILNQTDTAAGNILGNDDLGTPPVTYTIAGAPPPQTYIPVDGITSQPMGTFTYEPNGTYVFTSNGVTGVAMFLYVLQNAGGLDAATVTIEVTELN